MSTVRLQVALARAGIASRRRVITIIQSGRVTVNGQIERAHGRRVDTSQDHILCDNRPVLFGRKNRYYILNKPADVLSTLRDERGRKTVLDYFPRDGARLFPVGRLDRNSQGLIIITNDGELTYRLTHPKFRIERVYRVVAGGSVEAEDVRRLTKGVVVMGELLRADRVSAKKITGGTTVLTVVIHEGKKREVRNMIRAIGHRVITLKRIAYGPLRLKGLKEGAVRALTADEVRRLRKCVGIS
jgi:23S rRNA pseudouridine2605 synthase